MSSPASRNRSVAIVAGALALGMIGAAYAAGLAARYWESTDDIVANWAFDKRWRPSMAPPERDRLFARWNKAVTRSFDWIDG